MPLLTYDLVLGWPWVGDFVGFIVIFVLFSNPSEFDNLANTLRTYSLVRLGWCRVGLGWFVLVEGRNIVSKV